ncbi:MAG: hypothetical protein ACOVO1_13450, partial [Chitinophagaceae bacterium]
MKKSILLLTFSMQCLLTIAQNIFSGEPVQVVGQMNGYSTGSAANSTFRRVSVSSGTPTDGRGQWVKTYNAQSSGGDVTNTNMSGGGGAGFLLISGPSSGGSCGGRYNNRWVFSGVGQGAVNSINSTIYRSNCTGTDMGLNMSTAGRYTFVFRDVGYTETNASYYVAYTSNAPVTVSRSSQTVNFNRSATIGITTSSTPSSGENVFVRYTTGSDFNSSTTVVQATGSGTSWSATIPTLSLGATVRYYIFTSTRTLAQMNAHSESDKHIALINYDDNSGNNFTYTLNATFQSSATGNFSESGTWTNHPPLEGASYTIVGNHTITLDLASASIGSLTFFDNTSILSLNGNSLTITGAVSGGGFFRGSNTSSLTLLGNAGTINLDQTTDGSHLNPTTGTNSLGNLTLSGSGNLTLGNKVNLYGALTTATGTTLNTGDGLLVFRNTATTTARVADLTAGAGTISGTVRSEMYLHAQRRAWRFITNPTPTSGGTIANNWQSNFGHASNYGTNIYSPSGTGFDGTTVSASMMKFNSALNTTGGYDNVTNTGDLLDGTYFMFVRGDKTVTAGVNNAWVSTTLASKGDIKRGTQTITLNGLNGRYGAIPNPYLSPVDVSLLSYTGIAGNNASYHWDPSLGSFGGWVSINNTNWSGISDFRRNMQIGQSALVLMNSATASVVFEEADKVSTKTTQQTGAGNGLQDNFKTTLYIANSDGSKTRADEMFVAFKNGYNPNFDGNEDAVKMNNSGENLSSKRDNTLIAIEARPYIQNSDSIFMNFTNTRVANYEFEFDPSNFDATVTSAKLVDKFLNNETPISLSAKTTVPFSV